VFKNNFVKLTGKFPQALTIKKSKQPCTQSSESNSLIAIYMSYFKLSLLVMDGLVKPIREDVARPIIGG